MAEAVATFRIAVDFCEMYGKEIPCHTKKMRDIYFSRMINL